MTIAVQSVKAQNTATAAAGAVIQTALTISQEADLHFGLIGPSSAGGSNVVTIATTGGRSIAGAGNGQLITGTPAPTNALFSLVGQGTNAYNIVITPPTGNTISDGTNTMAIGSWLARASGESSDGLTGSLSGGTGTIAVGASLTVSQAQVAATYTGQFGVTVAYQ